LDDSHLACYQALMLLIVLSSDLTQTTRYAVAITTTRLQTPCRYL